MPKIPLVQRNVLLSVRDTAEYLNRTEDWVRRVLRYEVPIIQNGNRGPVFFEQRDVDAWVAAHREVPAK